MFYGATDSHPMSRPEIDRARIVCGGCPVRDSCLLYALDTDEGWGIWGGYTRPERARAIEALGTPECVAIAFEGGIIVVEGSAPIVTIEFAPRELDDLVRLS